MSEVRREQVLYEEFSKGNFVPLIMILILDKWEKQEEIVWDSFKKEIQEIQGPTEILDFYTTLSTCVKMSEETGMYEHAPWHISGHYHSNPYKKEQAESMRLIYLNSAQQKAQNR